jgi:hypothetical protein
MSKSIAKQPQQGFTLTSAIFARNQRPELEPERHKVVRGTVKWEGLMTIRSH